MGFLKLFKAIIHRNLHIHMQEIMWFEHKDFNNILNLSILLNDATAQDMIACIDSSISRIKVLGLKQTSSGTKWQQIVPDTLLSSLYKLTFLSFTIAVLGII